MSVTHFDAFDDAEFTEQAWCGTVVFENYNYSSNWNYLSCKKCLKSRDKFEAEIKAINKHRDEQDGAFVDFMIKEGKYPKEINL